MSDTHGFHRHLRVPDGDVLVHCGDADVTPERPEQPRKNVRDFVEWFNSQPHSSKIFVAGNHDMGPKFGTLDHSVKRDRDTHTVAGLKVFLARYDRAGFTYGLVPSGVDVLVTHEPPFGILDGAYPRGMVFSPPLRSTVGDKEAVHIGSKKLRHALDALGKANAAPRVHLFGHIHEAHGTVLINGTLYANAANANGGHAKRLEHASCVVIDVPHDRDQPAVLVQSGR